ncbi:hypothetical protein BOX15_Mlig024613g1, partial [Macrostomum lignano]
RHAETSAPAPAAAAIQRRRRPGFALLHRLSARLLSPRRLPSAPSSGSDCRSVDDADDLDDAEGAQCEYCLASFITQTELLSHRFAEHESSHVWCPTCELLFSSRLMFSRHVDCHRAVAAAAGSDVAPGLDELIADSHEGHRHFAQRLTVCRYCEFTCQQGAELADHVETEHVDDSTYWLAPLTQPDCLDAWLRFLDCRAGCGASAAACGICGDWIRLGASGDPEPLFLHLLRSHHPAELAGRAFRCVACPAASHTAAAAASHFWLCHCQRHRTRCPRCCRMVAQGGRHSCQHRLAGDRRLCLGCGREFASLSALRQHRLRPGDPAVAAACRAAASRPRRVRACEHCGRRFLHRANLLRHRRIHAASRLYRCPHCASAFSDVSNLAKHARCRHPGRPLLTCRLCRQFACDRVPEMRAHLAHCHSDSVCPADLRRVLRFLGLVADDAAGRSAADASADVPEGGRVAPVRERRSRMSAKLAAATISFY